VSRPDNAEAVKAYVSRYQAMSTPDVAALTYLNPENWNPENWHEFGTHRTRYRRTPR